MNKSYSNTTNDSHPTSKKIDKISVSKVNSLFRNLSKSHFIYSDISSGYDGLDISFTWHDEQNIIFFSNFWKFGLVSLEKQLIKNGLIKPKKDVRRHLSEKFLDSAHVRLKQEYCHQKEALQAECLKNFKVCVLILRMYYII